MSTDAISIIHTCKRIYGLGNVDYINHVQILKIKEVWWVAVIPIHTDKFGAIFFTTEVEKTQSNLKAYFDKHNKTLLEDYVKKSWS
jgi:UDPglucose--hexose-1-phosphate uridylyltransferase